MAISIHAPHTGRDTTDQQDAHSQQQFQSTRPIRGATNSVSGLMYTDSDFNPRAPYGARHNRLSDNMLCNNNFNPRAPYGARLCLFLLLTPFLDFNPRAPYGARRLFLLADL